MVLQRVEALVSQLEETAFSFGKEPLLTFPDGRDVDLASGFIPLLVNFTHEDKAAKGLRKRGPDAVPEPPIHFTALELLRDNKILLLSGDSGSGKTTFAKWLCWWCITQDRRSSGGEEVMRNDYGDWRGEVWNVGHTVPWYFAVKSEKQSKEIVETTVPDLLSWLKHQPETKETSAILILDDVKNSGTNTPQFLDGLINLVARLDHIRLLILADTVFANSWRPRTDVAKHSILPLLSSQRRQAVARSTSLPRNEIQSGLGSAAASPAIFALALQAGDAGHSAEETLDAWLSRIAPHKEELEHLTTYAFDCVKDDSSTTVRADKLKSFRTFKGSHLLSVALVGQLLAAKYLVTQSVKVVLELFHSSPTEMAVILASLLVRFGDSPKAHELVDGLLDSSDSSAQCAALIVADSKSTERVVYQARIKKLMLQIVEQGSLSVKEREKAGQVLSHLGDPRDLQALVSVPAGKFQMGSNTHPNSQPVHQSSVEGFRIGVFPVVVRDYAKFIETTQREWRSLEGQNAEKLNVPATDLTWHDANAYCRWLTSNWRENGKIEQDEEVRLPSEAEWERAARGGLEIAHEGELVYTWSTSFVEDAANSEEAGLNRPCAVGLFPKGRSTYDCCDMAGQVWEWCSTLWGEDMATPSFKYPYEGKDGREAAEAPPTVRRVLRGGCFSSGASKATCTYRGSLEPDGFWRGNGFRIVVAKMR